MWYLGAALAYASSYPYHANKAEALALLAAALAAAYLGEHLSAHGKAWLLQAQSHANGGKANKAPPGGEGGEEERIKV